MQRRIIAAITALLLTLCITACTTIPQTPLEELMSDINSANESMGQESEIENSEESSAESSEDSSDESSEESSEPSEESSDASSKETSSKPESSKETSSKPESSKEESSKVSSKPVSSTPVSSKPVSSNTTPVTPSGDELAGVWISYLELSSFAGSSQSTFTSRVSAMMKKVKNAGCNAVFVQVRPFGDAIYPSNVYPWSKTVSGSVGKSLSYDPFKIMVEQAHANGLECHAWINPYRLMKDAELAKVSTDYRIGEWYQSDDRDKYMYDVDGTWWLKPGNSEAQALIADGAREILKNYAVDGLHIDDYFYAVTPSTIGDTASQAKQNNTTLVKTLYNLTHQLRPNAVFGVSPAGGFLKGNNVPNSDIGALSTNLSLWCKQSGYIDYVMPQIYWDENHATQPYTMTLDKWRNFVTSSSVKLYVGIALYKGFDDATIEAQKQAALGKADGYCLYRYDFM